MTKSVAIAGLAAIAFAMTSANAGAMTIAAPSRIAAAAPQSDGIEHIGCRWRGCGGGYYWGLRPYYWGGYYAPYPYGYYAPYHPYPFWGGGWRRRW
jgi:hypothetical protein